MDNSGKFAHNVIGGQRRKSNRIGGQREGCSYFEIGGQRRQEDEWRYNLVDVYNIHYVKNVL